MLTRCSEFVVAVVVGVCVFVCLVHLYGPAKQLLNNHNHNLYLLRVGVSVVLCYSSSSYLSFCLFVFCYKYYIAIVAQYTRALRAHAHNSTR